METIPRWPWRNISGPITFANRVTEDLTRFPDRFEGALLGLAIGDAIGAQVEFAQPGTFEPVSDMLGGGPFRLKAGQWTDDTSMALCLAESLLEMRAFDAADQLERYVKWWKYGYNSSTGTCFDIGTTVRAALETYEETGEAPMDEADPHAAGNGSLMRLAPAALFAFGKKDIKATCEVCAACSRTTHTAQAAVDARRLFGAMLQFAIDDAEKDALLSPRLLDWEDYGNAAYWQAAPLCPEIQTILVEESYKTNNPPYIAASGYVVKSLEAALWAFFNSRSFTEGLLMAVNLGNDADTVGAIYGQLAGAFYGAQGIPKEWRDRLFMGNEIEEIAKAQYGQAVDDALRGG